MKSLGFYLAAGLILFGCSTGDDKNESESPKVRQERPEVVMETTMGIITLELFPDAAPKHVERFLDLVDDGFYNGLTFHRALKGSLIQGGDPRGDGTGNAGTTIPAEISNLQHLPGTLAMARGEDPNSASCQFYICLTQIPALDGKYTVFGQVVEGLDVADKISRVEVKINPAIGNEKSLPVQPVRIISVQVKSKG